MKSIIVTTLTFLFLVTFSFSQRRVALHHQGSVQIFSSANALQEAYDLATNGDTIYLPGGQYNGISLSKKVYIYGAGYHLDSTNATNYTFINGDILFIDGSDGAIIQGLYIGGNVESAYDHKIDSIKIRRNYIGGWIKLNGNFDALEITKSTGIEIYDNIICGPFVSCQFATNINIHHNILKRLLHIKENGWIHHNIWQGSSYNSIAEVYNSLFENNYIQYGFWGIAGSNNTFIKNALDFDPAGNLTNSWINNYINISSATLFVNPTTPFNFTQFPLANFNLNNPSNYLGSDGTQIGLFGGSKPFKQGGLPENPHIRYKNIAPQTDSNGNLNIEIKVGAQNN